MTHFFSIDSYDSTLGWLNTIVQSNSHISTWNLDGGVVQKVLFPWIRANLLENVAKLLHKLNEPQYNSIRTVEFKVFLLAWEKDGYSDNEWEMKAHSVLKEAKRTHNLSILIQNQKRKSPTPDLQQKYDTIKQVAEKFDSLRDVHEARRYSTSSYGSTILYDSSDEELDEIFRQVGGMEL